MKADCGYEEWDAQTERISGKQNYSLSHGILITGQKQTAAQNWADTGSPAEGECQTDQKRA